MLELLLLLIPAIYIILSIIFYCFPLLIHTRKQYNNPFFDQLIDSSGIVCMAHRGGAFEGPQNTMERFKDGVGVRHIIELDICLTKDKKIVVCHDPNLLRLCGVNREVKSFNYDQLPTLLEYYKPYGREQLMKSNKNKLTLLEDVFKEFPSTPINVELKDFTEEMRIEVNKLVKKCNREHSIIWGMEGKENENLIAINPEVASIFQPSEIIKLLLFSFIGLLPFISVRKAFLQIPLMCPQLRKNLDEDYQGMTKYFTIFQYYLVSFAARIFVPHLRKRGILAFFWTIDDEQGFAEAIKIGGAGIITDVPTKLANYLKNREIYYGDNKEQSMNRMIQQSFN